MQDLTAKQELTAETQGGGIPMPPLRGIMADYAGQASPCLSYPRACRPPQALEEADAMVICLQSMTVTWDM